jgi:hypothetical protein
MEVQTKQTFPCHLYESSRTNNTYLQHSSSRWQTVTFPLSPAYLRGRHGDNFGSSHVINIDCLYYNQLLSLFSLILWFRSDEIFNRRRKYRRSAETFKCFAVRITKAWENAYTIRQLLRIREIKKIGSIRKV